MGIRKVIDNINANAAAERYRTFRASFARMTKITFLKLVHYVFSPKKLLAGFIKSSKNT